jgi:hypothetical protein
MEAATKAMKVWQAPSSYPVTATNLQPGEKTCKYNLSYSIVAVYRITGRIHDYRLELSAANSYARDHINELLLPKKVHTNTNRTEYDKADSLCI